MLKLNDKEIGYIAGMIDGEGCICLHKCTWKHRNVSYYRPFIKIANCHLPVLIWIKNKLGTGSIKVEHEQTDNWKKAYTLNFSANMIRQFIHLITDSLIIKKEQALLVTEFLKISNKSVPKNFRVDNEELYLYYYNKLKDLNFRGVKGKSDELLGTPTPTGQEDNQQPSSQSEKVQRLLENSDILNNQLERPTRK